MRKQFCIVVALALSACTAPTPATAATYTEVLSRDVVRTMSRSSDAIPDSVEDAYWTCWARSFVATQIGKADLAELDKLAQAGRSDAPLAVKWRDRVDAALLDPESRVNYEIDGAMGRECPDTLAEVRSY